MIKHFTPGEAYLTMEVTGVFGRLKNFAKGINDQLFQGNSNEFPFYVVPSRKVI